MNAFAPGCAVTLAPLSSDRAAGSRLAYGHPQCPALTRRRAVRRSPWPVHADEVACTTDGRGRLAPLPGKGGGMDWSRRRRTTGRPGCWGAYIVVLLLLGSKLKNQECDCPMRLTGDEVAELQAKYSYLTNYDADEPDAPIDPLTYVDSNGDALLHIAAKQRDLRTVELFLRAGVDVDLVGDTGNTALHYAQTEAVAKLLLARGASADVRAQTLPMQRCVLRRASLHPSRSRCLCLGSYRETSGGRTERRAVVMQGSSRLQ